MTFCDVEVASFIHTLEREFRLTASIQITCLQFVNTTTAMRFSELLNRPLNVQAIERLNFLYLRCLAASVWKDSLVEVRRLI